jgi:hypothetical protein
MTPTYWRAAAAFDRSLFVVVYPLVIEGELLSFLDMFFGKYCQARNSLNSPPFSDTIWFARVVDVSGDASAMAGVNVHLVTQLEHVISIAVHVSCNHPVDRFLCHSFAYVFNDKVPRLASLVYPQSTSL